MNNTGPLLSRYYWRNVDVSDGLAKVYGDSSTLSKLHKIEDAAIIYNVHYCRAGVGFCFYEPPDDFEIKFPYKSEEWRKYLNVHAYYPTFEEAVDVEYKRLGLAD